MYGKFKKIKGLLSLFKPGQRSILGLDITSTDVKMLELSEANGILRIENYGYEILPPNVMDGTLIKNMDGVASSIKKLINQSQTRCRQVALAVPDTAIISKIVQLANGLSDEELEERVVIEADKYIPYPIEEINLDFEILRHSAQTPDLLDVLIVASRAENVSNRIETVTLAGLDPVIVDVASYAMERAAQPLVSNLSGVGGNKLIAILDMSMSSIHLFVLDEMRLIYSREEPLANMQMREHAAISHNKENSSANYKLKVLERFKEHGLWQIKRMLHFFCSTNSSQGPEYILLAGDLARVNGLDDLIQQHLGIMTSIANPFTNLLPGKRVDWDTITKDAPTLMVAFGLALRNTEPGYGAH